MDNVYDSLQGLIDETFVRDEDKDADIESYGNKGRYWIRVTYEKARGCWKEGLVGFLFFALFLHVIVQASNYIKFILLLDARYVSNEFCAAYIVMPFAVWAWSTAYDGFNFWNRKIRLFGLCVVHLFVMVLNFSSAILAEPIFWFWSCYRLALVRPGQDYAYHPARRSFDNLLRICFGGIWQQDYEAGAY